ncbi:SAM hydrolase/SAM-dependent halogenase family protein [Flavobacterium celericrescens]|uniref:SAM-dependent chlorinase/fluorinase n=1 Tax=Flavobacterium celericrescens TaxID=2709780 RepID=A0ABX0IEP0_9FLAO|nr:SAM-dependent chlorinase/fluorinase [Flavobacterium celericrescens]NHM04798.1 SAM-dependent chlorinase/fluorinase [Flavobacterium celericrescens]
MSIITLTTDFGHKDYFVGALKGKIISELKEAVIVDISHDIDLFNTLEASYCIEAAYSNFPKGTIHIIGVDSERVADTQHIALQWDDHFFICADNGILNALLQKKVAQKIVAINIHDRLHNNASDMDVFVAVACHIARGGLLNVIGKEITELKNVNAASTIVSNDLTTLKGQIIYIDSFGNCVTNISQKQFIDVARNRAYEIQVKNKKITRIHKNYSDFPIVENKQLKDFEGDFLALFNENGFLEIAIYKSNPKTVGSASTLLGLKFRDMITIEFKN